MAKRAKTLLGLLGQFVKLRWSETSPRMKLVGLAVLVLGSLTALQLGACFLGGCPSSASPCSSAASQTEPCPYSSRVDESAPVAAEDTASEDVPPCHRRSAD